MIQHYNQNYTKQDINNTLKMIKECIKNDKYTISKNENRQENIDFINEYNIRINRQKSILLELNVTDFCYTLQNTKVGYEYEVLYVFVPQVNLNDINGVEKTVDIYIKINIIDTSSENRVVVISFHKCNKRVGYLFR